MLLRGAEDLELDLIVMEAAEKWRDHVAQTTWKRGKNTIERMLARIYTG